MPSNIDHLEIDVEGPITTTIIPESVEISPSTDTLTNGSADLPEADVTHVDDAKKKGDAFGDHTVTLEDVKPKDRRTWTQRILPPPFSTPPPAPLPTSPNSRRSEVSFLSRWLYFYMSPLMHAGFTRDLTNADYPLLEAHDDSRVLSDRLMSAWDAEVKKEKESQKGYKASLGRAVIHAFGLQFLLCGYLYLCEVLAVTGSSYCLGRLLVWFQTAVANDVSGITTPKKEGFLWALGLCLCEYAHAICHQSEFWGSVHVGVGVRTAFIATIYRKSLELGLGHTSSTGYILNLISNDVQRFEDAAPFAHYIWVAPIHLLLVTYFVYNNLGYAGFASIGVLLLFIPLQFWFGRIFAALRRKTSVERDERIKSGSDMLGGVQVVKLYAWEKPFIAKISKLRDTELGSIKNASILRAINESLYFASNSLVNIAGFLVFHFTGGVFTPAKVFTTITYMNQCRLSMANFFPRAVQFTFEALVSLHRVQSFLSLPSMIAPTPESVAAAEELCNSHGDDAMVVIESGSFAWTSEGEKRRVILEDVDLVVRKGELCCVVGSVGSGKSSLLNAILGEMVLVSGRVGVRPASSPSDTGLCRPKVAYAGQSPWITSATVKENILFGSKWDKGRFEWTLRICQMERDVGLFEEGVETLIGERGVTLSGGQRARLALARAVYYDADIIILDDPLSAVDTKVGRALFESCICELVKEGKAVILVSHQLQYVRAVGGDGGVPGRVVLLEGGRVRAQGRYEDVMGLEGEGGFRGTMREFWRRPEGVDGEVDDSVEEEVKQDQKKNGAELRKRGVKKEEKGEEESSAGKKKEFTVEESATGTVPFKTYYQYFSSGAPLPIVLLLTFALILGEVSRVVTDYWLSRWSSQPAPAQVDLKWPLAFGLLVVVTLTLSLTRGIGFFLLCWRASRFLFSSMLTSVFRSPMDFFQKTPHGRLMNRFSKDMNMVDELLPQTFYDFMQCFFMILGTVGVAVVIVPYVLVLVPVVLVFFVGLRRYYVRASRQIKRLESTTRSPIYSNIPSTLEGLSTLRSFSATNRTLSHFLHLQNENTKIYFMFQGAAKWLGIRLDLMSATLLFVVTFFAVGMREKLGLSGGTVGLLLSYMLALIGLLQWATRQSAEVENQMVCVERILEYTRLPSEAPPITSTRPPPNWPTDGALTINNMSLSYPSSTRPVLRNITLSIPPATKVGIVGRTGAGKSSFLQALVRIVEPTPAGSIEIDGLKTSDLGLEDLRSRMSIIPQEPFCFKGTLRFNIDPFNVYDDAQIWRVLEAVELKSVVEGLPGKLDAEVSENGSNWSVGERQLICLARAILKKTKVIVMDEATSAVDLRTDAVIQEAVRDAGRGMFGSATVLTIAHRLNTVIDYDMVLVLDDGQVVEVGTPWELLEKPVAGPSAWFARMVGEMGSEAQELLKRLAWEKECRRRDAEAGNGAK
ncbi:Multidrug resistance-associated protein 4 [Rhizophlyctis rosea]|nr:Multidrug resistance-associated protein 4 [Rhizophlyctis rosea]